MDVLRLEISDSVEGLYNLYSENKEAEQLHSYGAIDLCLFFAYAKSRFSHDAAHFYGILSKSSISYHQI